jgi:hypothetical protein
MKPCNRITTALTVPVRRAFTKGRKKELKDVKKCLLPLFEEAHADVMTDDVVPSPSQPSHQAGDQEDGLSPLYFLCKLRCDACPGINDLCVGVLPPNDVPPADWNECDGLRVWVHSCFFDDDARGAFMKTHCVSYGLVGLVAHDRHFSLDAFSARLFGDRNAILSIRDDLFVVGCCTDTDESASERILCSLLCSMEDRHNACPGYPSLHEVLDQGWAHYMHRCVCY